jgi:hypothetical protein
MSIVDIATKMQAVKAELDELKAKTTELQKEFDELRKVKLPEAMEEAGMESARISGVGVVSLRTDAYVSIKGGKKEEAYRWLAEHGYEDLVTDYVQPSTLKAFAKEQYDQGRSLPEDLFSFNPYTYAAITKR